MKRLIILLLVMLFPSMVFASSITKEDIENSIKKFYPDASYSVSDNTIAITVENETVNFSYEMDENYITFTNKVTLSNGMSYDNFKDTVNSLSNVLLGYMIVADIKGVETEKIGNYVFYILLDSISKAFNSGGTDTILIVDDDTDVANGTEYIRKSDFPNQVLYYTKKTYTNTEYRDNADEMINSMLITTSLTNETTDSIDMTEVIKVNLNADYQKLNQFEDISTLFDDNINNQNNNNTNNLITENYDQINNSNSSNDNDTLPAPEVSNPKTGINSYTILIGISIISLISYILVRKIKLFKKLG